AGAVVAEGLESAKPFIAGLCRAQQALAEEAAKDVREFPLFPAYNDDVYAAVESEAAKKRPKLLKQPGKQERDDATNALMAEVVEKLEEQFPERGKEIAAAYNGLMKAIVRDMILTDGFRIDGRATDAIRDLGVEIELIPRAHGSALFERGETQILGVTTLDMLKMKQQIDSLGPVSSKRYFHHYNFRPYSTGETGRVGS